MSKRFVELAKTPGGPGTVAAILAQMDAAFRAAALAEIAEHDPALARLVQDRMFTFEDLGRLDARTLSTLLRLVDRKDLALALRGIAAEKREAILAGLSDRARALVREDADAMGPQRAKDVEDARRRIVKAARTLEAEGTVRLLPEPGERWIR